MRWTRHIKWWWQRRIRGYDDRICWDLSHHLAQLILPRLKLFRDKRGDPGFMMAGHPVPHEGYGPKDWEADIDLMVDAMDYIVRQDDDICLKPTSVYYPEAARRDEVKQAGCAKFGEMFLALWD